MPFVWLEGRLVPRHSRTISIFPFAVWAPMSSTQFCYHIEASSPARSMLMFNPQLDYRKIATIYGNGMYPQEHPSISSYRPLP